LGLDGDKCSEAEASIFTFSLDGILEYELATLALILIYLSQLLSNRTHFAKEK
jgi:hypothetical protein